MLKQLKIFLIIVLASLATMAQAMDGSAEKSIERKDASALEKDAASKKNLEEALERAKEEAFTQWLIARVKKEGAMPVQSRFDGWARLEREDQIRRDKESLDELWKKIRGVRGVGALVIKKG